MTDDARRTAESANTCWRPAARAACAPSTSPSSTTRRSPSASRRPRCRRWASASTCRPSTPPPRKFRFPRSHRLTKGSEIQQIGTKGKRIRTKHLEVRILASPLRHPRVGFIVPRYGHSAVDRNRLKRRLRDIIRTRVLRTLPPIDVVIRVRPSAYAISFAQLADELVKGGDEARRILL